MIPAHTIYGHTWQLVLVAVLCPVEWLRPIGTLPRSWLTTYHVQKLIRHTEVQHTHTQTHTHTIKPGPIHKVHYITYRELFLEATNSFPGLGRGEGVNGDPEVSDTDACVPTGYVLIKGIMDEGVLGLRWDGEEE